MVTPVPGTVVLQGLTRRFGDAVAVDRLSLEVAEGELFGLLGPDGAGKTTTLRMLAGVLRPSDGEALVAGVPMSRDPESAKPHLAYMAQRFGLYEDLTVRENLAFYADLFRVPKGERPARLERLYRFSRLGEFQDRLAGALSGGMKQKLALSCALVHQPRILLLDEPTFGVDPISRRELWLILDEMVAAGTTVVVSTSYMDEAERCHRVGLLHQGALLAVDTPQALRRSLPGSLWAVQGDNPRAVRDRLRETPGVSGAALFGSVIHAHLSPGVAWRSVAERVQEPGGPALHAEAIEAGLEDVFIQRVREAEQRD